MVGLAISYLYVLMEKGAFAVGRMADWPGRGLVGCSGLVE